MDFETILKAVNDLNLNQIQTLKATIENIEPIKRSQYISALRADLDEKLSLDGLSFDDLVTCSKPLPPTRTPIPAKYQDSINPSNTWSGRGRTPKWMQAHLDAGHQKDDFLIRDK